MAGVGRPVRALCGACGEGLLTDSCLPVKPLGASWDWLGRGR